MVFTTLHILQLKRLVLVKRFAKWIVCIYVLIMQVHISKKKGVNKYLIFNSIDKNKELLKKYNDAF